MTKTTGDPKKGSKPEKPAPFIHFARMMAQPRFSSKPVTFSAPSCR